MRQGQACEPSTCWSSPASYISIMSRSRRRTRRYVELRDGRPLGVVLDALAHGFVSSTLNVSGRPRRRDLRICNGAAGEAAHGNCAVPFMKSTTRLFLTRSSMRWFTSLMVARRAGPAMSIGDRRGYTAKRTLLPLCVPMPLGRGSERVGNADLQQRREAQVAHGVVEALCTQAHGRARAKPHETEVCR